jgi:hypothetical protein
LGVEEFFIITNLLTPNGDEINDCVWITNSLAEIIEAKVFNRWGLLVWQGADLEAGTYYYVVGLNYGEAGVKSYITPVRE